MQNPRALRQHFMRRWGRLLYGGAPIEMVHFLQGKGLLSVRKLCIVCNRFMELEPHRCPDKYRWRCRRPCRRALRLRSGTFFEPWQEITLADLIYGIFLWSQNCLGSTIEAITKLPHRVVMQLCRRLRECCSAALIRNPIQIGGNGVNYVVQVDESQFHHRQRQRMGRIARQPVWVFGIVDTRFVPAKGYMEIVQQRNRATLTAIINARLRMNSVIHSDQWAAYNNLPQHVPACIHHDTVNHTYNFVDPATGAHTQHVESYWNRVKMKIKRMKGCRRVYLASYLDEFMWRDWYGGNDHFDSIIDEINIQYPQ